jgi:proton glutamate symport protein
LSLTARVISGLTIGLAAGVAAYATRSPVLISLAAFAEPIGTLWVNAILMTVVPLVVASLIVGVAAAGDASFVGRLGRESLALFLLLVSFSSLATALIAPALLSWFPVSPATTASLRAGVASASAAHLAVPSAKDWLVGLVPPNPIKAAADGAMLPVVVFTLLFALAVSRIEVARRQAVVGFFESVAAAMRVLVGWVLVLAPLGVFALTFPLAARVGAAAAGALVYYFALVATMCAVLLIAVYPIATIGGRVSLRRFARAAAPAQAVGFSARSSLATLPALIDAAEQRLGLPPAVTGFCLPLAVSTFKLCAPTTVLIGILFSCRIYGVALDSSHLAQAAVASVLLSFAVPGVPGGALLVAAPIFAAVGLPAAAIGILLAVETIPDMLRTPVNVTADLAVAAIVARHAPSAGVTSVLESTTMARGF